MDKKIDFFYCYNKRLSDFLTTEGIKYITVAKDIKKNRMFSLYIINKELQTALDKYKNQ